jgi:hypothetical protein
MPGAWLLATLRDLSSREIEFILVGGVAAVLQGAALQTFDLDLVYSLEPANTERLLRFFESVDRIQPERRQAPDRTYLAAGGHLNLLTRYGPIDLLGFNGKHLGYAELRPHSVEMEVGQGVTIRVLDLETLIRVKEELGSEKDVARAPDSAANAADEKAPRAGRALRMCKSAYVCTPRNPRSRPSRRARSRVWHSQITRTFQPAPRRARTALRSRAMLRCCFASQ